MNTNKVEIPISIGVSHWGEITIGAQVQLSIEQGTMIWKGKVVRISRKVKQQERTFSVFVEANGKTIPPGTFVTGKIVGKLYRNVFVIPRKAFINKTIFVVEKNKNKIIARARKPIISKFLPDFVLVEKGVKKGEQIVVSGIEEVANGSFITIIN